MSSIKITEGLYSVGVLNPNLRVFDIVMQADYGTSYNSFVIKDEKTVLIETCHLTFFEEYLANIEEVTPLSEIDAIILNHTEPDHSGALKKLLELCPKAEIYSTKAAEIYLKKIVNSNELRTHAIKDGDTLSIGKNELKFFIQPFLHWPDTMFTYCEGLKAVFTCDFLGSHFCEPRMKDSKVTYKKKFRNAIKEYYDAIFSPFKPYVIKGLDRLNTLEFDSVLVSHGPIITKEGEYDYITKMYREWSEATDEKNYIPVFYTSAYGYTAKLAEVAKEEIRKAFPGYEVNMYDIIENDITSLSEIMNKSKAFMIGTPTINKDAVPPVWNLLSHIDAIGAQRKPVGVFGSYGWSGEAVPSVVARLLGIRMKVIGNGCVANFCPSEEEKEKMAEYTREFIAAIK